MYFEQKDGGLLRAYGKMEGLPPGLHRMTINEYGDLSNGCYSTGKRIEDFGLFSVSRDGEAEFDFTSQ